MIEVTNSADVTNITISGAVGSLYKDGYTLEKLKESITDGVSNVVVDLKTLGGDSFEAIAIYDYLKSLPTLVTTRIIGNTASAGFTIWAAGDVREISKNSKGLIHKGRTKTEGDATDHENAVEVLNNHDDQIAGIYQEATGKRIAIIKDLMDKAKWMTAEELIKLGFAHKIIEQKPILNEVDMETTNIRTILNVADDAGIEAAIIALQTENERLTGIVNQIEADKQSAHETEITNYVTDAVTAGKVTEAVKDSLINLAKTDFEAVKNIVEAAKPAPLSNHIEEGQQEPAKMTKAEATQIYNSWVAKNKAARMQVDQPDKYLEVRNAMKGIE